MNRLKQFRGHFRFREDIRVQSSKISCPRIQRLRGNAILALDNPPFLFVQNIVIGFVNTPKYFF